MDKNKYIIKDFNGSVSDMDMQSRTVKFQFSAFNNTDLDGDVIVAGAFKKSIAERGPQGNNSIWHLADHMPSLKHAIGKPSEITETPDGAIAVTKIPNTTFGNDVLELYATGAITQHSFAGQSIQSEMQGETRIIKEIQLWEVSSVIWGANPNTPTIEVTKGNKLDMSIFDKLEALQKTLSKGNISDETGELIELQIKLIKSELQSTFAALQAQGPQKDELLDAIKQFNNKFNI